MNPAFLRRLAERCWNLVRSARSNATREQLQIWAQEFEREADAAERPDKLSEITPRCRPGSVASEGPATA